jgi:hypothetical protein
MGGVRIGSSHAASTTSSELTVSMNGQPRGTYLAQITEGTQLVETYKFVK